MTIPKLYAAPRTGGKLLRLDEGNTDDGTAFDGYGETVAFAPGGIGGEAVFYRIFLALTHSAAAQWTLRLTPIIAAKDGAVEKPSIDITVPASAGGRVTIRREIGLSEAYSRDATVRFRTAPRGEWLAVRLQSIGGAPSGDVIIDRLAIESEVVRESLGAENAT